MKPPNTRSKHRAARLEIGRETIHKKDSTLGSSGAANDVFTYLPNGHRGHPKCDILASRNEIGTRDTMPMTPHGSCPKSLLSIETQTEQVRFQSRLNNSTRGMHVIVGFKRYHPPRMDSTVRRKSNLVGHSSFALASTRGQDSTVGHLGKRSNGASKLISSTFRLKRDSSNAPTTNAHNNANDLSAWARVESQRIQSSISGSRIQ